MQKLTGAGLANADQLLLRPHGLHGLLAASLEYLPTIDFGRALTLLTLVVMSMVITGAAPAVAVPTTTILEINGDIDSFAGQTVTVEGYFGLPGDAFLITDYELIKRNEIPPEYSYLILEGNIPPETSQSSFGEVTGTVEKFLYQYPTHGVAEGARIDVTSFAGFPAGPPPVVLRQSREQLSSGIGVLNLPPNNNCWFAIIIAGGGNDSSKYSRYWNDTVLKWETLTNEGFLDANIEVVYDGGTKTNKAGEVAQPTGMTIDRSATKDSLTDAFDAIAAKIKNCKKNGYRPFVKIFTTDHGEGYDTDDDPVGDGYSGGKIDTDGDEGAADRIKEEDLKLDGSSLPTPPAGEVFYEWDLDNDGTPETRLARDADGDVLLRKFIGGVWQLVDIDITGDGVIDAADGGVDLNGDGDWDDSFGFDEVLNLRGDETVTDDEFKNLVQKLRDAGLSKEDILIEMEQCFSGGFIPDLKDMVDAIATAAAENEPSHWGRLGVGNYDVFEYYFMKALEAKFSWKKAFEYAKGKVEALEAASDGEAPDRPQYAGGEGSQFPITGSNTYFLGVLGLAGILVGFLLLARNPKNR